MRLILVRHAESEANVKNIYGDETVPLTERGHGQAKRAGEKLRNEQLDIAYVSTFIRAQQTAEHILTHHPRTKRCVDERAREQDFGEFIGKAGGSYSAAASTANVPYIEFQPKDGETILQVRKRMHDFYLDLVRNHPNDTVLVVSHGSAITSLLMKVLNVPDAEFARVFPHNTGITTLDVTANGEIAAHIVNDTSHLQE